MERKPVSRADNQRVYRWRRSSRAGIEVLRLEMSTEQVRARGEIVDAGGGDPFALFYDWLLSPEWRTRRLELHLRGAKVRDLLIERAGPSRWTVDGRERAISPAVIDISATPFCNTLTLRRFGAAPSIPASARSSQLIWAIGVSCSERDGCEQPHPLRRDAFLQLASGSAPGDSSRAAGSFNEPKEQNGTPE
jgi:hypothetical protein